VLVTTDQLLALLVTMVSVLLFLALIAGAGLFYFLIRRLRGRPRARRTTAPVAVPPAAPTTPPRASAGRSHTADEPVPKGDVVRDDPRIIALGLEAPLSIAAVFRNLDKIKPLLRQEVPESDRIGRTTPLAGGALRATGVYLWTFPANRGGLDAPYADAISSV